MLLIACPWCGPRDETEFVNGGDAHIARPTPAEDVSAADWAGYLFFHDNPRGWLAERWVHAFGCRQWLHVERDTATHEIRRVYRLDEPRRAEGE